mgnify:CR=1 FL=1
MTQLTDQQALQRVIEHREIFHDEMLGLMRRIMQGEMSPVVMAALITGLRVKKETVGEIAAAAQVMREFATPVHVSDKDHLVDLCGTGGDGLLLGVQNSTAVMPRRSRASMIVFTTTWGSSVTVKRRSSGVEM